jgi:nitrite reductase (cytochrome c-552)
VAAAASTALLVNIMERKQEARNPFFRVVELSDDTEDPAVWGKNFPAAVRRVSAHRRSATHASRRQRGAAADTDRGRPALVVAQQRIEDDPRLKTMWAGHAPINTAPCARPPLPSKRVPPLHRGSGRRVTN